VSLDQNCKEKMEEVMIGGRDRGRGSTNLDGGGGSSTTDGEVTLPLGPGEWEEALGLPLCVVCQNVGASCPSYYCYILKLAFMLTHKSSQIK
jgi:dynein light intermediate chain 1